MPLLSLTDLINGTPAVQSVGNFNTWTLLHLQVQGPGDVRLSTELSTLNFNPSDPFLGGIRIAAADGIKSLWWFGPCFAIATLPGTKMSIETVSFSPGSGQNYQVILPMNW